MHRTETHHTSSSPQSQTKKLPKYQEVKERGDIGRVEDREGWWQSVLAPPIHPPDTSNEIIITRPPPPRHHWGSSPPFQRNYSRRGFATNTLCSRVRALCVWLDCSLAWSDQAPVDCAELGPLCSTDAAHLRLLSNATLFKLTNFFLLLPPKRTFFAAAETQEHISPLLPN